MRIIIINTREPIMVTLKGAFEKAGHQALVIDESPQLFSDLKQHIEHFKPDALITNNFDFLSQNAEADAIEDYLKSRGILSLSWFFESPEISGGSQFLGRWIQNRPPKHFIIAASDSYFLHFYRSHGIECFYLPMAVDAQSLPNPQQDLPVYDSLLFSGAPVSGGTQLSLSDEALPEFYINWCLNDLEHLRGLPIAPPIESLFHQQLMQLFSLKSRFDESFRANRRSWSKTHDQLQVNEVDRIVWSIFGSRVDYLFSGYQLTQTLRDLQRRISLHVFGSPEWKTLIPQLGNEPRRLEQSELFRFFAQYSATLCMTKQTFQRFIHERIWMIFACGGFPIVDEREDLWQFFDRDDIATYCSSSEIPDLFRFYLKNPHKRKQMIERGRTMVLRDHTYDQRAKMLIEKIKHYQHLTCSKTTSQLQKHDAPQRAEPSLN